MIARKEFPPLAQVRLLTTEEAARFLTVDPRTLEGWRYQSIGPDYIKLNHLVRYRLDALQDWLDANTQTAPVAVEVAQ